MTENQPREFEDMTEPETCENCGEYFDADVCENWVSVPFHLICPWCGCTMYPQPDTIQEARGDW